MTTPPSSSLDVGSPSPESVCKQLGLNLTPSSLPLHRVHWLHVPKTGSSFGTTLMHRGCPRIPTDAAADDGAPIVSLTTAYPRGQRRWCDRGAFLGNLNGHEPTRYPEHRFHTVALFRAPRARLLSECAAIEQEFVRAFGTQRAELPHDRAAQPAPKRMQSYRWEWRAGSVYADSFLREFLYSHGFSHRAIAQLTFAWNRWRALPLSSCLATEGMLGCQTKMVLGIPCSAPMQMNASLLQEAARRIREDFRFVGVPTTLQSLRDVLFAI